MPHDVQRRIAGETTELNSRRALIRSCFPGASQRNFWEASYIGNACNYWIFALLAAG
jgi:hypothetical protein